MKALICGRPSPLDGAFLFSGAILPLAAPSISRNSSQNINGIFARQICIRCHCRHDRRDLTAVALITTGKKPEAVLDRITSVASHPPIHHSSRMKAK